MRSKDLRRATAAAFLLGFAVCAAGAELAVVQLNPPPGATNICSDTPLQLAFNEPVRLAGVGKLRVIRTDNQKVVDVLDLADSGYTNQFGTKLLRYEPIRIDGSNVTVQLRAHVLDAGTNTTFSVVLDSGLFRLAGGGASAAVTNGQWQFTTRAPIPKGRTRLEVAPDSRGDFCTLQGAVDYIPEDNYTPFEIFIHNGTYDGVAYLGPGRNRVRIAGEDRAKTILAGRNNDQLNPGRMMRPFVSVDSDDVTVENLTLQNTTPYRGSQAEALRMAGQRCVIRNCNFYSFQDTLLLNGRIYVANCYVEGDVDFIWGHGVIFFEDCELKAMHDGYYITSRNPADQFGFVFSRCKLTAAPGVKKNWLARIGTDRFPGSAVAFLNCQMGEHIPAAGWQVTGNDQAGLRFYEFQSTTLDGQPLDVSQRHPASRQITAAEAAELADPNKVLATRDTWKPKP
jgi:pectin methylesterase-like acyl-CoA thioesterase